MAESSKPELKKPLVRKVFELRPLDSGLTLTVKVVDAKMVAPKGRQARISECLVGDETGMIIFVARNDQGTPFLLVFSYDAHYVLQFLYLRIFLFPILWHFMFCHRHIMNRCNECGLMSQGTYCLQITLGMENVD